MVIVNLTMALICFGVPVKCEPILYGKETPVGVYNMVNRNVLHPGYGGDVLQYFEDEKQVYAIHRIWLLNPKQHRLERLANPDPKQHMITDGCINVMPEVYEELKNCCSNETLVIQ